ncbi:GAF and HD-GYP domain-containing protein [Candidatus Omnitrophota bacterium]
MDDKLKFLLNATSQITKQKNIQDTLTTLSNIMRTLLNAERASIYLHDQERKELWTIVSTDVSQIRISDNAGIAGEVFQTGAIINIENAYQDPRFDQGVDKKTGYTTSSILTYPLKNSDDKLIGVFQIMNKLTSEAFDADDELLLRHISIYIAAQIENNFLQAELKKASEDVIYRLSYTTKFKDPETQSHIIRVGLYGKEIAKLLGWDAEKQDLIKLAAPMHDIGKVAIPDHILQKPGKLDPDEWQIMMTHSHCGYEILKGGNSKLMHMAAMIAEDHHEKVDGTGYPNQKKGDQISLVGRIAAVSDVFDALTSERCYKKAWAFEDAAQLIREEKDRQFDGHIAELFLSALDTMIKIKEDYRDE